MGSKPCFFCKRFFNEHTTKELFECDAEIIKGVRDT